MAPQKKTSHDTFALLRKQAESILAAQEEALPVMTPDEMRKTVHELHTYQIELELQNEALRQAQEELLVSQKKFTDLYDFAPVGYLTVSETGLIIEANLTAAKMLNMERGFLLNKPLTPFFCGKEQDSHYLCRSRLLKTKVDQSCQRLIQRQDGSEFDAQCRCVTAPELDGNNGQFRMAITDISEQKNAERERAALEMQLRQSYKMQAVGTLAGGIAHEFNNLLGIIMGFTELALDQLPADHSPRNNLDKVMIASHRAKDLIKQLLTFSRKSAHERLVTPLQPLVKEAISLIEPSLPSSVKIIEDIAPGALTALVDPTEVQQIVINVCANAVWAMKEKGYLEIKLTQEKLADEEAEMVGLPAVEYALLSFRDSGTGMDRDTLARIFDPFFTTKEVGQGTGMGLSIAHGIMESYGGKILVKSEVDKGTTFHFYFPLTVDPLTVQEPETKVYPGKGEHILFVDDEELYAEMSREMLSHLGYKVDLRLNSREALDAFKAAPEQYDLVITDQIMPNMFGDELIKEIKAIRSEIPVILCTGFSNQVNEQKIKNLQINAFAHKPLVKGMLTKLIRKVLDEQR